MNCGQCRHFDKHTYQSGVMLATDTGTCDVELAWGAEMIVKADLNSDHCDCFEFGEEEVVDTSLQEQINCLDNLLVALDDRVEKLGLLMAQLDVGLAAYMGKCNWAIERIEKLEKDPFYAVREQRRMERKERGEYR